MDLSKGPSGWSFSTCIDYKVPIQEQIDAACRVGFTHVSPSRPSHAGYDTPSGLSRLRDLVGAANMRVESLHAPNVLGDDGLDVLRRTIYAAAELAADVVVVHAWQFEVAESDVPTHLARCASLCHSVERDLEATGVRVALENLMPGPASDLVGAALEELNPTLFGFCFDSSHDQIDGPRPLDLLRRLRYRLIALHLSDRSAPFVDHLPLGDGFIDWAGIAAELQGMGYARPYLLELIRRRADKTVMDLLGRALEAARQRLPLT